MALGSTQTAGGGLFSNLSALSSATNNPAPAGAGAGFSFGATAPAPVSVPTTAPPAFGFGLGGGAPATSVPTTAPPAFGGFGLGGGAVSTSVPTTAPPSFGFGMAAASTAQPAAAANPILSGMVGGTSTASVPPTTGLKLTGFSNPPPAASTAATGGLGALKLPTASATTQASGFSLTGGSSLFSGAASSVAAATGTAPTLTLGATGGAAGLTAAPFSLGGPAKAPTSTASAPLTLGGGGLFSQPAAAIQPAATTSAAPAPAFNKGLDGQVKTTSLAQSSNKPASSGDQNHDTKPVPAEIINQFTEFEKHIKKQKEISANKSTSSKDKMDKVRDQTTNMRQLLSTVAMGLHRNVTALEKLKTQTKQSLYDIEMATGTRLMIESGAASAREYTAPDQYFYNLLESFESRMATYRRLIEDTEGYILGAQQGSTVTPKDLFICLKRLHETFIALAAQLQGIHEQIKIQKEQYLAYRKVFHNDDTDVFERRRREVLEKAKLPRMSQPVGPSPFAGLSNYAAMMLTQAMQAPQQAQQPVAATGFGLGQTGGGLFGAAKPATGGFGFGTAATGTSGGLFGATAAKPNPFGATTTQTTGGLFGAAAAKPATGFGFGATPAATGQTSLFGGAAAAKPSSLFGATTSTAGTTGTAFGFPSSTAAAKPTSLFGSTTSAFGATKPLGLAVPQQQSLGASAPGGFTLQPPPAKRTG